MRREQVEIEAPSIGGAGTVIGYGHYGRPVLLFPAEQGRAWDLEGTGMIDAVAELIEAGRVKLYCVDSYDGASWSNQAIALEENADNNRVMASALGAQGYPVRLHEGRDLHNYTAWRDLWDPHLTRLLQETWR